MKKIISILLAVVMVFSAMPLTALAEDVVIDNQEILGASLDYTAYDAIVTMVKELDKAPYTDETLEALANSIADRDSFETQEAIDDAVTAISTAYTNLAKKSFDVYFVVMDSNENIKQQKKTYFYGDEAEFEVTDTDEVATKWILSTDEADKKLNVSGNSYSMVVTESVTITAITDVAPEVVEQIQKVKFLSINGKVVDIIYTLDIDNIEMPEAPKVPFYNFDEWEKIDDLTYQAKYTLDPLCDGEHHSFYVETIKAGCDTVGYLIFRCECGEAYSTEYVRQTGHNFDNESEYCLNGCGKLNPNFDDLEKAQPEETPTVPSTPDVEETTKPSEDEIHPGFDEGGYNNIVIAP